MAKKRFDVTDITNDLQHSAFFPAAQPLEPAALVALVAPNASGTPSALDARDGHTTQGESPATTAVTPIVPPQPAQPMPLTVPAASPSSIAGSDALELAEAAFQSRQQAIPHLGLPHSAPRTAPATDMPLTVAPPAAQERAPHPAHLPEAAASVDSAEKSTQTAPQDDSLLAREQASVSASPQTSMHASMLARDQARIAAPAPDINAVSAPIERSANLMTGSGTPAIPSAERPEAERAEAERASDISELVGIPSVIEGIRRRVRQIGKEVSFVRLTPEEKRQLTDIAYLYKSQGVKTSENEISRIGINWMLDDYRTHGATSVLARVLAALNA